MKRRTKEDNDFNNELLKEIFEENSYGRNIATVGKIALTSKGYRGSLPYCTPTAYKDFLIRQIPRSYSAGTVYSILKLDMK
jgi:hypothetical protein